MNEIEREAASSWLEIRRSGELVSHVVGEYFRALVELGAASRGEPVRVRKPNAEAVFRLAGVDALIVSDAERGELFYERERAPAGLRPFRSFLGPLGLVSRRRGNPDGRRSDTGHVAGRPA